MSIRYPTLQTSILKLFTFIVAILCFLQDPVFAETKDEDLVKSPGLWKRWQQHMDKVLEKVIELDLWGISTPQLPKGVWKIKYSYEHQKATEKYDDFGNKVPIAPSLEFPDVLGSSENVFTVDLQGPNGGGEGTGHTIQMSYGITDPLDFYIEFPFQHAEVLFDVDYQPGPALYKPLCDILNLEKWKVYQALLLGADLRTEEGFWQFVESMGRPRLKTHYRSKGWDMGDIHFGLSWNYYKGKYFAAATTNRVYVPSGYEPDANNNIELFTGAGFPAGTRSWGLSTTQGFDFRLPDPLKWVVFNIEFTYEYRFKSRRDSPVFPKRNPWFQLLYEALAQEEPDIAALFPDLSNMGDYWFITYGHSFDGEVGLTLNPLQILPIGIKYAGGWSQKPTIESESQEFVNYVEAVEIVGEQVKHMLAVGTGISLIPFYIPLNIAFEYHFPLGGKGAFVIEENYKITAELFLTF